METIDEYTAQLLSTLRTTRQALVDQLVAGTDSAEFVRGQIKGLDRGITAAADAGKAFVSNSPDDAQRRFRPGSGRARQ